MQYSMKEEGRMEDYDRDICVEPEEIDEDYEFDAANFFDFMRVESDSEIEEAERWFEFSGDYPDSPFVVKMDFEKLLSMETLSQTSKSMCSTNTNLISRDEVSDGKGINQWLLHQKNAAKTHIKPDDGFSQPRSSTFLKPTLSHLLKQRKVCDNHLCARLSRTTSKGEYKPSGIGSSLDTKRQKLDIGYLKKVAQLKHQFSLLHKSGKKVTTPKQPELQTLLRAQNRRSVNGYPPSEMDKQKQKGCSFSMHSFNKKFFHTKTKEKANCHASAKVYPSAKDVELSQGPPVAQLSKLSLGSDAKKRSTTSDSNKDTLEKRNCTKSSLCGGHDGAKTAKCWPNMTRSLLR